MLDILEKLIQAYIILLLVAGVVVGLIAGALFF